MLETDSLCSVLELAQFGWDPCDGPPSLLPLCPPRAGSGTGEHSWGSGSAPSLFPVGQRNPSNLGESDEAVSVSQLSAVRWGTHVWSWVPAVPRSPNGYSITDFPRFSAFLRWLCLFFSIGYNLGLLMDKDVAVSHHQNFLCQISLTETVFSDIWNQVNTAPMLIRAGSPLLYIQHHEQELGILGRCNFKQYVFLMGQICFA